MQRYAVSHLADHVLVRDLKLIMTRDRATTAELVAHLGELDARRLHRQAAYASLFAYCVGELRMSEDMAYKRVQAARAARRFPALLPAIAAGRLHLSGVVLLAPHMTRENAAGLFDAAAGRTSKAIRRLVAERFPQPDVPTQVIAIPQRVTGAELVSKPVRVTIPEHAAGPAHDAAQGGGELQLDACASAAAPAQMPAPACAPAPATAPCAHVTPLSPRRYAVQFTADQELHDALEYARTLVGHDVAPGDVAGLLKLALAALIAQREKRKFGATDRPRKGHGASTGRRVPAAVRREVWQRDGGRCTFVSDAGHRCEERADLEFDHADPVARGGPSTVANVRLRCRPHNQLAADQAFGAGFMREKREGARVRKEAVPAGRAESRPAGDGLFDSV